MPIRFSRVVRESARSVTATPVTTLAVAAIVACASAGVLLTAGRAAALERDVIASVEDAGTRTIVMRSLGEADGFDPSIVDRIEDLSGVEWALGLGRARDVYNEGIPDGDPVSSRSVFGDWPGALSLQRGTPIPGTAVVSSHAAERLQFTDEVGTVLLDDSAVPVVATFTAQRPLEDLNNTVLRIPSHEEPDELLTLIYIVTERVADVEMVADHAPDVSGIDDVQDVSVSTSDKLVKLQGVLTGQLSTFARQMAVVVLLGSLVLIMLCMVLMTNSRRREFGRRRALGASRRMLIGMVAVGSAVPGIVGAVVGGVLGIIILMVRGEPVPGVSMVLASAILTIAVAVVGSLPAAFVAAWRDPATILRVP